jgi:hypothetical protein
MKSITKPFLYLSAYPLTAVKQSNISSNKPGSPYLRALLSGANTGTKEKSKVRKLSLASSNNYQKRPQQSDKSKMPSNIELTEKDWFKNYE